MSETSPNTAITQLSQSRGWLIFSGFLSIVVGFMAIGSPYLFSAFLVQFLGAFALISGCISLALAIFSKHVAHRVLDAVLSLIRIAAGVVLLRCVASSIAVITLILAVFFIVEGVAFIVGAIKLRSHAGWIWTLINGIAALFLGVLVYARWPFDSFGVLGLLFGINSLFWGVSLLALAFGAPKAAAA
ncbi:MAG: HdeD family acid-resistance protein [Terrimicrobiaceae bacterium]